MKTIKKIGKSVLPRSWIYFYHSLRVANKLGIFLILFRTLPNAVRKIRLGGEAGWTIPKGVLNKESLCYCVGCGEDISFDLELIKYYACPIYAFDPTPRAIAYVKKHTANVKNYQLAEIGIWEKEGTVKFYIPDDPEQVSHSITNLEGTHRYIEVRTRRLKQVLEENGHTNIALFKMDIEGAEHAVIRTIIEDKIQIGILCIEFDELAQHSTPERLASINSSIQSLINYGFRLFWVEGSNFTFVR